MHVHKTKVTRPRPRRSTFKTETRRDVPKKRLETASRPRRSRPRLHPWTSPTNHSSYRKTRWLALSYKNVAELSLSFCYNSRVWQTHGQTDGRTDSCRQQELASTCRCALKMQRLWKHYSVCIDSIRFRTQQNIKLAQLCTDNSFIRVCCSAGEPEDDRSATIRTDNF